jgi:RNA polymerase sigma-70 factor (ECF subfamily)
VERALAGDHEAYGALVDTYSRPIFNLALRMLNDAEDARDLSQTAFVKAYQKLHTFDRSHRFFSWIYRIALNESLNLLKRRRRVEELDERLIAKGPSPEEQSVASQEEGMVREAMMDLTPEYREVITLRHFLDLSHREMSDMLHIPEKTVKSRLHTARERLGVALRRRGYRP